jgi:hypothetical protein
MAKCILVPILIHMMLGMIGIIWIGVVSYRIRATLQRFSLLNNQHVYRLKLKHIRYIITRLSHKVVYHIF